MAWKILFYESESGRSPVKKFLDNLQSKVQQKIFAYLKLLSEHGTELASNYLEKVKNGIWALRPEYGGNEYRIFFFMSDKKIILVHAILKNTRQLPKTDVKTAENRMEEWLQRQKGGR